MRRIIFLATFLIASVLFMSMDCNESLPPYEGPQEVFSLNLGTSFPHPEAVRMDMGQIAIGHKKIYFDLDLVNVFDETTADSSRQVLGEISLWWDEDPNVKATFPVMNHHELSTNVFEYPMFVVMDPGDSVRFSVWWQYCLDDQGLYMWDHIDEIWYSTEGNHTYFNYGPMDFTVQAKLQPYARGPVVYSNIYKMSVTFFKEADW